MYKIWPMREIVSIFVSAMKVLKYKEYSAESQLII